jgi:hypothetical protein
MWNFTSDLAQLPLRSIVEAIKRMKNWEIVEKLITKHAIINALVFIIRNNMINHYAGSRWRVELGFPMRMAAALFGDSTVLEIYGHSFDLTSVRRLCVPKLIRQQIDRGREYRRKRFKHKRAVLVKSIEKSVTAAIYTPNQLMLSDFSEGVLRSICEFLVTKLN